MANLTESPRETGDSVITKAKQVNRAMDIHRVEFFPGTVSGFGIVLAILVFELLSSFFVQFFRR